MIQGYFDYSGHPRVNGYVVIPGFNLNPIPVPFLFDTGADGTCVHPGDAIALGIPVRNLTPTVKSQGVGGATYYQTFPAFVGFQRSRRFWRNAQMLVFRLELAIAVPDKGNWNLPSLLGRDIIDRCRIDYNPVKDTLRCSPHSVDNVIDL